MFKIASSVGSQSSLPAVVSLLLVLRVHEQRAFGTYSVYEFCRLQHSCYVNLGIGILPSFHSIYPDLSIGIVPTVISLYQESINQQYFLVIRIESLHGHPQPLSLTMKLSSIFQTLTIASFSKLGYTMTLCPRNILLQSPSHV